MVFAYGRVTYIYKSHLIQHWLKNDIDCTGIVDQMNDKGSTALAAALVRMLRPLVKLLLKRGVSFKAFSDIAKWVFVNVAEQDFGLGGRKNSMSRVSVLTGLSRKEVAKLFSLNEPRDRESSETYNRLTRVITAWSRDREFTNKRGGPASLEIKGNGTSFSELVRRYSGDMTPRAMLDELLRVGAVKMLQDGRVKLMMRTYVPGSGDGVKIHILGRDVGLLIATIDHNLHNTETAEGDNPFFQRKVLYDNLPAEALPEFRIMTAENAQRLLEKFNAWLVERDRDSNPELKGTGRYVAGVGIYYFEEPYTEE